MALVCWKCGAALTGVPQPFSRRAECPACHAELHVCRMCTLYNPLIAERCEEPRAEHPRTADIPNFCDYFKPRANARQSRDSAKTTRARANLDSLFGGGPAGESGDARSRLDDLFGGKKKDDH